jgi:DNA-binding CsgD family transcriptional regulator/putative methionine-R-sulfoxide reductase with GAF domain
MSDQLTYSLQTEALGKKLRAVRLIQELCLEMDAYLQVPQILQMILRSLDDVLGFANSMIYLVNPDGATLSFQAGWGYSEGYSGVDILFGQGFIGVSAKSGEVLHIKIEASSLKDKLGETVPLPGLPQVESMMAVPLKTRAGVIGVILVERVHPNTFGEIDQELLLLVAGQTARLIAEVRQDKAQELKPLAGLLLLTKREHEVAVLIGQGLSNKEIALRLFISVRTVTSHLERIYQKLEICTRSALVNYIYEQSRLF